jgi:hypothetical protein
MSVFRTRGLQAAAIALTGVGVIAVLGCGDDTGIGKRYPVSGTVTYKGEPLASGRIEFEPADPAKGRPATGEIHDGSYRLTTLTPDDGALPGDYKVTITAQQVDTSQVVKTIMEKGGGGRQHEIAKAQQGAKNLIPAKYRLADTSGLTAKVEERSNTADFELKDF